MAVISAYSHCCMAGMTWRAAMFAALKIPHLTLGGMTLLF